MVNYCLQVETWPDNLPAAGSGQSETTVSLPACAPCAHSFCFVISTSRSRLFADSLPFFVFLFFTITPCVCTSSFFFFFSSSVSVSLQTYFPTTLVFILEGHSPLRGCSCQCRAVNSWAGRKHKLAQTKG